LQLLPSTISAAEDDVSIAAHVQWLQKQFKRVNRDSAGIKERMDRTFGDRLKMIEQSPVPEVLEKYVFLRDPYEVGC